MTIKAILWTYEPKKNGTCNIKLYLNNNGQKKYIKTKLAVLPQQFDTVKGLVKKSHPSYQIYNATIRSKILELERHFLEGGSFKTIGNKKSFSLILFLENYIKDSDAGLTEISVSSCKAYKSTLKRLKQFCKHQEISDLSFDDINLEFHDNFKRFLLNSKICAIPGFNVHIKNLKKCMRLAMEKKLHNNSDFRHRLFKKIPVESNKIYLTREEIQRIEELDLSFNKMLSREKDRFLISYYFLTRYIDSILIRRKDFFQKEGKYFLQYTQKKTGAKCIIPVSQAAWSILERRDFNLSGDTNGEANKKIKLIASMAGINTIVNEGAQSAPKWSFITTHTARRSAATHLALQGVNLKIIADLGGWKRLETLRDYLRASGLDSAEVAKDLDFFQ